VTSAKVFSAGALNFGGQVLLWPEATMLLEAHGHRRDYVDAYRSWGKFLRRAGREEEALEVLERAGDLAAEPLAETQTHQLGS